MVRQKRNNQATDSEVLPPILSLSSENLVAAGSDYLVQLERVLEKDPALKAHVLDGRLAQRRAFGPQGHIRNADFSEYVKKYFPLEDKAFLVSQIPADRNVIAVGTFLGDEPAMLAAASKRKVVSVDRDKFLVEAQKRAFNKAGLGNAFAVHGGLPGLLIKNDKNSGLQIGPASILPNSISADLKDGNYSLFFNRSLFTILNHTMLDNMRALGGHGRMKLMGAIASDWKQLMGEKDAVYIQDSYADIGQSLHFLNSGDDDEMMRVAYASSDGLPDNELKDSNLAGYMERRFEGLWGLSAKCLRVKDNKWAFKLEARD